MMITCMGQNHSTCSFHQKGPLFRGLAIMENRHMKGNKQSIPSISDGHIKHVLAMGESEEGQERTKTREGLQQQMLNGDGRWWQDMGMEMKMWWRNQQLYKKVCIGMIWWMSEMSVAKEGWDITQGCATKRVETYRIEKQKMRKLRRGSWLGKKTWKGKETSEQWDQWKKEIRGKRRDDTWDRQGRPMEETGQEEWWKRGGNRKGNERKMRREKGKDKRGKQDGERERET